MTFSFFLLISLSGSYHVPKYCVINFLSDVFSSVIQQLIESLLTQRVSFNDSNQPDFPLLRF